LIVVDTSVWVDHLRRGDAALAALLDAGRALIHPFVIGEIACGSLADRQPLLVLLQSLPMATTAGADEVLAFIDKRGLHGQGIGYVDVHLLASTLLTPGAALWTRDKRLRAAAEALGCAHAGAASH
jgi:predicted nucleic acid-binding protein